MPKTSKNARPSSRVYRVYRRGSREFYKGTHRKEWDRYGIGFFGINHMLSVIALLVARGNILEEDIQIWEYDLDEGGLTRYDAPGFKQMLQEKYTEPESD